MKDHSSSTKPLLLTVNFNDRIGLLFTKLCSSKESQKTKVIMMYQNHFPSLREDGIAGAYLSSRTKRERENKFSPWKGLKALLGHCPLNAIFTNWLISRYPIPCLGRQGLKISGGWSRILQPPSPPHPHPHPWLQLLPGHPSKWWSW